MGPVHAGRLQIHHPNIISTSTSATAHKYLQIFLLFNLMKVAIITRSSIASRKSTSTPPYSALVSGGLLSEFLLRISFIEKQFPGCSFKGPGSYVNFLCPFRVQNIASTHHNTQVVYFVQGQKSGSGPVGGLVSCSPSISFQCRQQTQILNSLVNSIKLLSSTANSVSLEPGTIIPPPYTTDPILHLLLVMAQFFPQ
jgi:hypothetical protein